MNVVIAGGTGFIGRSVIKKLVEYGHHVIVLTRPGSLLKIVKFSGTETRYIYFDSPGQVAKTLEGGQAIINLVGIIRETKDISFDFAHHSIPQMLVKGAREVGISRFVHMSALGVDRQIATGYFESKQQGEKTIKNAPEIDWTIFRPSIVYGPQDDFVNMLARMIRRMPIVPVIGNGQYRLQPVWVEDVANGFARCLEMPQTIGKIYEIGGPETFTYNQVLDMIGLAQGNKRIAKIHLSLNIVRNLAKIFDRFGFFPITQDQITMLLAENITDNDLFFKEFNITPKSFFQGISEYLKLPK
jgi:NADH dehydrogenase